MTAPLIENCWIVTEGLAGTENQCLGVAEALGIIPEVKRIRLKEPWRTLSPCIGFEQSWSFKPRLTPPWPALLLASGRKSIAAARYIKKQSGGRTFTVQIQDPRVNPAQFDLVAVPAHDPARGKNVIVTTAAPNRITPERLEAARKAFPQFEKIRTPRVAVLIGGKSKAYDMGADTVRALTRQLRSLDAGLMITASRRTGDKNLSILKEALAGTDAYLWDGNGENPYFAFLAWADFILVTADSVSMLSDAAATGKPVYMIPLEGGAPRIDALHENLKKAGVLRIFEGRLEHWRYEPLSDAGKIAGEILRVMAAKKQARLDSPA